MNNSFTSGQKNLILIILLHVTRSYLCDEVVKVHGFQVDLSRKLGKFHNRSSNPPLQPSHKRIRNYYDKGRENMMIDMSKNDSGDQEKEFIDPIMILPISTLVAIVLLGIGVLYTKLTNPVVDFDVDFYMAIDGVKDSTLGLNSGDMDALYADTIVGLPQLSSAEKLVGALFGPH